MIPQCPRVAPAALFILTLMVASLFAVIGVDPHHDGVMLKQATDVAGGRILFREVFTQQGALPVLIQALSMVLFGRYLIVVRLSAAVFYALTSLALWHAWAKILPRWAATASCIIWLLMAPYYTRLFMPWPSVYALLFQALSLCLLLASLDRAHRGWLFAAGATSCMAFWCRQPVGILLGLAILVVLVILSAARMTPRGGWLKNTGVFMCGWLAVSSAFLAWLSLSGALRDWWLQTFVAAHAFAMKYGGGGTVYAVMRALLTRNGSWRPDGALLWLLLPLACVLLFVVACYEIGVRRKTTPANARVLAVSAIGIASWFQYYPLPCARHVYWGATPMVGLYLYLLIVLWRGENASGIRASCTSPKTLCALLVTLCMTAPLAACIVSNIRAGILTLQRAATECVTVEYPPVLRRMRVPRAAAAVYADAARTINGYLDSHPSTQFITLGQDALYLVFTERTPKVHPMYVNWRWINRSVYPDYRRTMTGYIHEHKPLILSYRPKLEGYYTLAIFAGGKAFLLAPVDNEEPRSLSE
ncbi:MAG: glycosyltransferase family 39 protein [Chlamydiota bacterium]